MTEWFRHRAWIPIGWLFVAGNLVAAWFATQAAEPTHALGHAVVAVWAAIYVRGLMARRRVARDDQWHETIDQNEDLRNTIEGMQTQLRELEERVDFTERLLAKREADRLDAPPR